MLYRDVCIPGVSIDGSCGRTSNDSFSCSGIGNHILWQRREIGTADFTIESVFEAAIVKGTSLCFVLWSGYKRMYIGLDGQSRNLFCEGGTC